MDDLIRRKDALDVLRLVQKTNDILYVPQRTRQALKNIPAVNAIEVVFCKDCVKHGAYNCSCQFESAPPTPDDFFCKDGERRETNDTSH